MTMKDLGSKLAVYIKELSEIEVLEIEILFAKFNNILKQYYEEKIKAIEENIDEQILFFGKKIEDYETEKSRIISKYTDEFQKIYDQRKEQYYNIIAEIQEAQANQKIALTNFTTVTNSIKNNSSNMYDKKQVALIEKYNNYDVIINEFIKKLDECIDNSINDFNEIVKYRNSNLDTIKKSNIIVNLIHKIMNKFSSKSKIEKEVIQKMESELLEIENNDNK